MADLTHIELAIGEDKAILTKASETLYMYNAAECQALAAECHMITAECQALTAEKQALISNHHILAAEIKRRSAELAE